jgi:hypothetical protein
MALLPPVWLSPRFPVRGDLNMDTVFDASGKSPVSGPTAKMMGLSGPSGSAFSGQCSKSNLVATPVPPSNFSKRSSLCSTWEVLFDRSMNNILEREVIWPLSP